MYTFPVTAAGTTQSDVFTVSFTGALDADSEYFVASFFAKMLAEINGDDVVLDPVQRLRENQKQEFQIKITRLDKRLDLILMHPAGARLDLTLITPGGQMIAADSGAGSWNTN